MGLDMDMNLNKLLGWWSMVSWLVLNFILVIFSDSSQMTHSLILPLARSFLGVGSLLFSGIQQILWCGGVCDSWIFWKQYFCPQNGQNKSKVGET